MPGRANDLIVIPDSFWQRAEVITALRSRRMGQFFELVHQHTGASQTRIGMACVMTQGKISDVVRGVTKIEDLAVFERIADGLKMPDYPGSCSPHAAYTKEVGSAHPATG